MTRAVLQLSVFLFSPQVACSGVDPLGLFASILPEVSSCLTTADTTSLSQVSSCTRESCTFHTHVDLSVSRWSVLPDRFPVCTSLTLRKMHLAAEQLLYILSPTRFPAVQRVDCSGAVLSGISESQVPLKSVKSVSAVEAGISPLVLPAFIHIFPNIEELEITEELLRTVLIFPSVKGLQLYGCDETVFEKFPNLWDLRITCDRPSCSFACVQHVIQVALSRSEGSDGGGLERFEARWELPLLTEPIPLRNWRINSRLKELRLHGLHLVELPDLPQSMEILDLQRTRFLREIRRLPQQLRKLDLSEAEFPGDILWDSLLERMTVLEELNLSYTDFHDVRTLQSFAGSLRRLDISYSGVDDVDALPHMPAMRNFSWRGNRGWPFANTFVLGTHLESLDVSEAGELASLADCPHLTRIHLGSARHLKYLPERAQSLRVLHLVGAPEVQNWDVLRSARQIEQVTLDNVNVYPDHVKRIIENQPLLKSLTLLYVSGMEEIRLDLSAMQQLEWVQLHGTPMLAIVFNGKYNKLESLNLKNVRRVYGVQNMEALQNLTLETSALGGEQLKLKSNVRFLTVHGTLPRLHGVISSQLQNLRVHGALHFPWDLVSATQTLENGVTITFLINFGNIQAVYHLMFIDAYRALTRLGARSGVEETVDFDFRLENIYGGLFWISAFVFWGIVSVIISFTS